MNLDLLVTLGAVVFAAIYLFSRFRKKNSGCCGCSGCSNDLQPKPSSGCPSKRI